jgi:hypothetical protein
MRVNSKPRPDESQIRKRNMGERVTNIGFGGEVQVANYYPSAVQDELRALEPITFFTDSTSEKLKMFKYGVVN